MALTIRLHESAGDSGIIDSLKELAYKVESIVDNSPDYVCCYYDGEHAEPELNVNGSAIIIGGSDTAYSVDSQIDDWINDIQTDIDAGNVTENDMFTSISFGIPYKEDSKDYTAGEDMPTKEEWDTIKRLFDPQDYDPHSDVASVDFYTLDELRKWIDSH